MIEDESEEVFPTLPDRPDIINALKKNKICNISRATGIIYIEHIYEKIPSIDKKDIFTSLSTVVRLHLDNNDVIAFYPDPIKYSVIAWFDVKSGEEKYTNYYFKDFVDFLFYDDPVYGDKDRYSHIIGKTIETITIATIPQEIRSAVFDDSFQRGIILKSGDSNIVISNCFYDIPGYQNSVFTVGDEKDLPKYFWRNTQKL